MEQNNNIQTSNIAEAPIKPVPIGYEGLPVAPTIDSKLNSPDLIPVDIGIKTKALKQMSSQESYDYNDTSGFDSLGASNKMKSEVRDIGRDEYIELSDGKLIPRFLRNVK